MNEGMMIWKNIVFCQYLEGHLLVALGDHEMCHVGENNAISRSLEREHERNVDGGFPDILTTRMVIALLCGNL